MSIFVQEAACNAAAQRERRRRLQMMLQARDVKAEDSVVSGCFQVPRSR